MGCLCCPIGRFISSLVYALERISSCAMCAALTCCMLLTIIMTCIFGIALGYHFCIVESNTYDLEELSTIMPSCLERRTGTGGAAGVRGDKFSGDNEDGHPIPERRLGSDPANYLSHHPFRKKKKRDANAKKSSAIEILKTAFGRHKRHIDEISIDESKQFVAATIWGKGNTLMDDTNVTDEELTIVNDTFVNRNDTIVDGNNNLMAGNYTFVPVNTTYIFGDNIRKGGNATFLAVNDTKKVDNNLFYVLNNLGEKRNITFRAGNKKWSHHNNTPVADNTFVAHNNTFAADSNTQNDTKSITGEQFERRETKEKHKVLGTKLVKLYDGPILDWAPNTQKIKVIAKHFWNSTIIS